MGAICPYDSGERLTIYCELTLKLVLDFFLIHFNVFPTDMLLLSCLGFVRRFWQLMVTRSIYVVRFS